MTSTAIYRSIMHVIEARRGELGLSMASVNDLAGLQDGFFAKMIYPDTPSGRQARWETVQLAVEALFGKNFAVQIVPDEAINRRVSTAIVTSPDISANARNVRHWRHRRHFVELSAKAALARAKIPEHKRKAAARKGAKKRWRRVRAAQRQGSRHVETNASK